MGCEVSRAGHGCRPRVDRADTLLAEGEGTAQALTSGYHLAFLVGLGLVVAAIGVALGVLRGEPALAEPGEETLADPAAPESVYAEAA